MKSAIELDGEAAELEARAQQLRRDAAAQRGRDRQEAMKQAEAGIARDTRILEARCTKPNFKTGIVMDDKVITLDIPWTTIAETEKAALAEYVLGLMRESRAVLN
jgi:hypothetical protein